MREPHFWTVQDKRSRASAPMTKLLLTPLSASAVPLSVSLKMGPFAPRIDETAGLEGPPLDAFLKACRGSLEYAQRRDYQQIVMIDGPNVLGDSEWRRIDSGFGLSTIRAGLKRIDVGKRLSERERRMLAVAVLGILNEASFALAREERGVSIDGCVDLVRRLIAMSLAG